MQNNDQQERQYNNTHTEFINTFAIPFILGIDFLNDFIQADYSNNQQGGADGSYRHQNLIADKVQRIQNIHIPAPGRNEAERMNIFQNTVSQNRNDTHKNDFRYTDKNGFFTGYFQFLNQGTDIGFQKRNGRSNSGKQHQYKKYCTLNASTREVGKYLWHGDKYQTDSGLFCRFFTTECHNCRNNHKTG